MAIATVLTGLGFYLMWENLYSLADERADPTSDAHSVVQIGALLPEKVAFVLFPLVTLPLLWRRVAPLPAVGAALAALVLNELLVGSDLLRCGVVLPTAFLFAFTAGVQLRGREAHIGLALALSLTVIDISIEFGLANMLVFAAVTVAVWGVGRVVRSRGRMATELEARTRELRDARDERARLEVSADRARLSAELDELLQRRLGELARMADEGVRSRAGEGAATATLVDIERESRRTLEEMRAVVGVLRNDEGDAPTAPQPTLTHLEALLVRAKGTAGHLTVDGSPRVLPAGVELSAYRVVEHLLDALDDSGNVDVRVNFASDALEIAVSGSPRRSAKAAIERARERVQLQRGTLEATTRGGRAEALASIPLLAGM